MTSTLKNTIIKNIYKSVFTPFGHTVHAAVMFSEKTQINFASRSKDCNHKTVVGTFFYGHTVHAAATLSEKTQINFASRSADHIHKRSGGLTNLFSIATWHNMKFGFGAGTNGNPALWLFNFPIYVYALCIVTGMCVAILVSALYFKKRGYDPYDITIYALVLIPFGVIGARLYVYIFPWENETTVDWSTIFDIRDGGLGIYGGVIFGFISAWILSKIKKQDFRIVTDSILPGVMIAQSIGRWGNFANQEAFGNLITHTYNALPHAQSGIFSRFNGYAVWIDGTWFSSVNPNVGGWYQATFFYESMCTLVGFLICVLVLTRSKHYKLGWCTAFYGIYYGIARLVIEGLRSDSLYLYVGTMQTNIKISQLVSVFSIVTGILLLTRVYRKELHALYKKLFKSDFDEMSKSRWLLLVLSLLLAGGATGMFVWSANVEFGQMQLIVGFFLAVAAVYSGLGVWSLFDRLKLYCPDCHECHVPKEQWQTPREQHFVAYVCYAVVTGALTLFGIFSLVKWGIVDGIPNGIVLFVACILTAVGFAVLKVMPEHKAFVTAEKAEGKTKATCTCGARYNYKLNKFLLFLFPPKVYRDYGVANLKPWVDPDKEKRQAKRAAKAAQTTAASDGASLVEQAPDNNEQNK